MNNAVSFFARKAQAKQKCLHFYLAPPANLRNSQSVFLMIVRKLRKKRKLIMKKMLVAASVLAAIAGVVAAVCKSRKKYTMARKIY